MVVTGVRSGRRRIRRLNERAFGFRLPLASAIALVGDQAVELLVERPIYGFRVANAQLARQRRRGRGRTLAGVVGQQRQSLLARGDVVLASRSLVLLSEKKDPFFAGCYPAVF